MDDNKPANEKLGEGFIEVGIDADTLDIIINHSKPLNLNEDGHGHFRFTLAQARDLADCLYAKIDEATEIALRELPGVRVIARMGKHKN